MIWAMVGLVVALAVLRLHPPDISMKRWTTLQARFPAAPIEPGARCFKGTDFRFLAPLYFQSAHRMRWGWFDAFLDQRCLHFCFGDAPEFCKGRGHISIPLEILVPPMYDGENACWLGESRQELWLFEDSLIKALRQVQERKASDPT